MGRPDQSRVFHSRPLPLANILLQFHPHGRCHTAPAPQVKLCPSHQPHRAILRHNLTLVLHLPGQKIHIPAVRPDFALVADAGGGGSSEGQLTAPHECVLVGVVSRRQEGADVDHRPIPDEYPVRIQQVNLAVGLQRPHQLRGVAGSHPVQDGRRGCRLNKAGGLPRGNREALPMDHRSVSALLNRGRCPG